MTTVTIQELKRRLAAVLARVRLGEWITVVKHGRPVARLGPPSDPGVHVGVRFDTGYRIVPLGRRLTRDAYLEALADDRLAGDR